MYPYCYLFSHHYLGSEQGGQELTEMVLSQSEDVLFRTNRNPKNYQKIRKNEKIKKTEKDEKRKQNAKILQSKPKPKRKLNIKNRIGGKHLQTRKMP